MLMHGANLNFAHQFFGQSRVVFIPNILRKLFFYQLSRQFNQARSERKSWLRLDQFLEARIVAQRIPLRIEP